MSYTVDYGGDWAWVDGVETASYVQPDGVTSGGAAVKVKRGALTRPELSGTSLALSPSDVVFVVWVSTLDTGTIEPEGVLTVDSVAYTVLDVQHRGDGAQRIVRTRKRV